MKEKKWFFSIFSGIIYWVFEDEVNVLDEGQVPLTQHPDKQCKHCYNRRYTGIDHATGYYKPCVKCLKKYIDSSWNSNKIRIPRFKNED